MALASSGSISIGGTTSGRSINLELSRSATASSNLNETALRSLAQRTSGSISLSHFHGKSSNIDTQVVTVGYCVGSLYLPSGYGLVPTQAGNASNCAGSISDGTCNFLSNAPISDLMWDYRVSSVAFRARTGSGTTTNSGFTTMTINGTSFSRSSANFQNDTTTGYTGWVWLNVTTNPFGTTVGATKTVVWT